MAIAVTTVPLYAFRGQDGIIIRMARLDVTGLVVSSTNNVPHGLKDQNGNAVKPLTVGIEPTSNQTLWEASVADATNIYVAAAAAAGTTCSIYVEY